MGYKSGEIYFVRETDLGSTDYTSFVKIGLVAGDRSSEDRLTEHQTGNPRRLKNQTVIATNAVHRVEAQLHRLYAPYRVGGEWFDFSDEKALKSAVETTQNLAKEMASYVPKFESAAALNATAEASSFAKTFMTAKTKLSLCKALADEIKAKLSAAIEAGEDVQGAAKTKTVTPAPKFSVTKFKAAHKELYEE